MNVYRSTAVCEFYNEENFRDKREQRMLKLRALFQRAARQMAWAGCEPEHKKV